MSRDLISAAFKWIWISCKCCLSRCVCSIRVEFKVWVCQRSNIESVGSHFIFKSAELILMRRGGWVRIESDAWWNFGNALTESIWLYIVYSTPASIDVYIHNLSWTIERSDDEDWVSCCVEFIVIAGREFASVVQFIELLMHLSVLLIFHGLSNSVWLNLFSTDGVILNSLSSCDLAYHSGTGSWVGWLFPFLYVWLGRSTILLCIWISSSGVEAGEILIVWDWFSRCGAFLGHNQPFECTCTIHICD